MPAKKITISIDSALAAAIRAEAEREGCSVSSWVAEAAAAELRYRRAIEAQKAYEDEFGPITEEQLKAVAEQWPDLIVSPRSSAESTEV